MRLSEDTELEISVITLYELLMGANDEQKERDVRLITSNVKILPFDKDAVLIASEIYHDLKKKRQLIEFRDIFIAASTIACNSHLLTLNQKHFQRITNLELVSLSEN